MLLNFDNAMYETNAIFQKISCVLGWKPILSNCEMYTPNYFKTVLKVINSELQMLSLSKIRPFKFRNGLATNSAYKSSSKTYEKTIIILT